MLLWPFQQPGFGPQIGGPQLDRDAENYCNSLLVTRAVHGFLRRTFVNNVKTFSKFKFKFDFSIFYFRFELIGAQTKVQVLYWSNVEEWSQLLIYLQKYDPSDHVGSSISGPPIQVFLGLCFPATIVPPVFLPEFVTFRSQVENRN